MPLRCVTTLASDAGTSAGDGGPTVKAKTKKAAPKKGKAAPDGDRDVRAEVRNLCADMTSLMLSEVLAEVKVIIEERRA